MSRTKPPVTCVFCAWRVDNRPRGLGQVYHEQPSPFPLVVHRDLHKHAASRVRQRVQRRRWAADWRWAVRTDDALASPGSARVRPQTSAWKRRPGEPGHRALRKARRSSWLADAESSQAAIRRAVPWFSGLPPNNKLAAGCSLATRRFRAPNWPLRKAIR